MVLLHLPSRWMVESPGCAAAVTAPILRLGILISRSCRIALIALEVGGQPV